MADMQQTVDELRLILQGDDGGYLEALEPSEELQQLVSAYAALCRECNRRLRQCENALRQGLRAEAIHLADSEPNLLEMVAVLDFPEREQLNAVVTAHQMTRPEPLMVEVAAALNEAYALQEPLLALLDQHRLLALARSPLPERLQILRTLIDMDPESEHWDEDIRDMERARFAEIDATCRTAAAKGDVGILKSLYSEITSSPWRESPPANLVRDLKVRAGAVIRSGAREKLEDLAPRLFAAMSALDLAEARALRDEWVKATKFAQLPQNDSLAETIAPILEWVDDEDRKEAQEKAFRRALAALEHGLEDDRLVSADLERLGAEVERFERVLPESLVVRYRNRVSGLKTAEKRHHYLMISSIVGFIILIAGVIGFPIYLGKAARQREQMMATINDLLTTGHRDEARRLLDQNTSEATTKEWAELRRKLAEADRQEQERKTEFTSLLASIGPAVDPDAALATLEQARPLAAEADEKSAINQLEREWKSRRAMAITEREDQFRAQLKSATDGLLMLDRLLTEDEADTDARIDAILQTVKSDLSTLDNAKAKVASGLATQVALLESRLTAFEKTRADTLKRRELLGKLTAAALNTFTDAESTACVSAYYDALKDYESAFPGSPETASFQKTAANDGMKLVAARQELLRPWNREFRPKDAAELDRRLQSCQDFLKANPRSPDFAIIENYETFLKSLKRRETGDDVSDVALKDRLVALYSGPLVGEGNVIRAKDGRTYYLPQSSNFTGNTLISFNYLSGYDGETRKLGKAFMPDQIESPKTAPPPHIALTNRVAKEIPKLTLDAWDDYQKKLALELLNTKAMDDFLRYFLILRTLKYAEMGNSLLEGQLDPAWTVLDESQVDLSVTWMDPDNEAANKTRKTTQELLGQLKPEMIETAWNNAGSRSAEMSRELFAVPTAIGCLLRSPKGDWTLNTTWTADAEYQLFITIENGSGDSPPLVWRNVGQITRQGQTLALPPAVTVTEGLVVYAMQRSPDGR